MQYRGGQRTYADLKHLSILLALEPGVVWAGPRALMGPPILQYFVEAPSYEEANVLAKAALRAVFADLGERPDEPFAALWPEPIVPPITRDFRDPHADR